MAQCRRLQAQESWGREGVKRTSLRHICSSHCRHWWPTSALGRMKGPGTRCYFDVGLRLAQVVPWKLDAGGVEVHEGDVQLGSGG